MAILIPPYEPPFRSKYWIITFDRYYEYNKEKMDRWCRDNLQGNEMNYDEGDWYIATYTRRAFFVHENDAVLFMMVWGN